MTDPAALKLRFWQMHLSTAILLMFAVPMIALSFLRTQPWVPEARALNQLEFEKQFPGLLEGKGGERMQSPDGTRIFLSEMFCRKAIGETGKSDKDGKLFDFSFWDQDKENWVNPKLVTLKMLEEDRRPRHIALGFLDDDRCAMGFSPDEKTIFVRIWHRRFPEWWWGHFYRPEVWAAGILSILLLWKALCAYRASR